MRILFDTNIVLDVLLTRQPFFTDSIKVWEANADGRIVGYITATTITNIYYIARKEIGKEKALEAVRVCLDSFEICEVNRAGLEMAVSQVGKDFEDNLQVACASLLGLDAIVTRDKRDFKGVTIPVLTPSEIK